MKGKIIIEIDFDYEDLIKYVKHEEADWGDLYTREQNILDYFEMRKDINTWILKDITNKEEIIEKANKLIDNK